MAQRKALFKSSAYPPPVIQLPQDPLSWFSYLTQRSVIHRHTVSKSGL